MSPTGLRDPRMVDGTLYGDRLTAAEKHLAHLRRSDAPASIHPILELLIAELRRLRGDDEDFAQHEDA